MKELDFDELDRAVNSLMEGVPKTKPAEDKSEEDTKTLTIKPSLPDGTTPDFKALDDQSPASPTVSAAASDGDAVVSPVPLPDPDPVAKPEVPSSVSSTPRSAPSLATRRGGRFMDVVHPSSDMKTSTPAPSRPVSRQGVTVEPVAAQMSEQQPVDEPVESPGEPAVVSGAPASSGQVSEWPDPLDMANFKQEDKEEAAPSAKSDEPAPLSSPFLSGTKVEKRPLGGPVSSDSQLTPDLGSASEPVSEDAQDDSLSVSDPAAQLPAEPGKLEAPLPEELRSDLMAIESGSHTTEEPVEPTVATEAQPDESKKSLAEEDKESAPASVTPAKDTAKNTEPAPTGPTSIAQQYKEEPSSGDQTSGAIYDTDTYHQPLAHPAKKKSGWMWVVWIVLILVIGAGGGAALYFLGII